MPAQVFDLQDDLFKDIGALDWTETTRILWDLKTKTNQQVQTEVNIYLVRINENTKHNLAARTKNNYSYKTFS